MHALVHPADIQDRDGGVLVMASLFGSYPFLLKLYADGGYQGPEFRSAVGKVIADVNIEIVKRSDQAKGLRGCWPEKLIPDYASLARIAPEPT